MRELVLARVMSVHPAVYVCIRLLPLPLSLSLRIYMYSFGPYCSPWEVVLAATAGMERRKKTFVLDSYKGPVLPLTTTSIFSFLSVSASLPLHHSPSSCLYLICFFFVPRSLPNIIHMYLNKYIFCALKKAIIKFTTSAFMDIFII